MGESIFAENRLLHARLWGGPFLVFFDDGGQECVVYFMFGMFLMRFQAKLRGGYRGAQVAETYKMFGMCVRGGYLMLCGRLC